MQSYPYLFDSPTYFAAFFMLCSVFYLKLGIYILMWKWDGNNENESFLIFM